MEKTTILEEPRNIDWEEMQKALERYENQTNNNKPVIAKDRNNKR